MIPILTSQVLRAFGDSCKDFDIPEDSEWASELIKEGFTLEFMKNALIRPILSLRNPELLLDWWRKVIRILVKCPLTRICERWRVGMVKRSRLQRGRSSSPTTTPASSSFSSRWVPEGNSCFLLYLLGRLALR